MHYMFILKQNRCVCATFEGLSYSIYKYKYLVQGRSKRRNWSFINLKRTSNMNQREHVEPHYCHTDVPRPHTKTGSCDKTAKQTCRVC